jgi:hypothetical protein
LNRLDYAGALRDPVASIIFCAPVHSDFTLVGGKTIVENGQLKTIDLPRHINQHNRAAQRLLSG